MTNNNIPLQPPSQQTPIVQKLAAVNEQAWLSLGNLAELMSEWERATSCYEAALRHNPYSATALFHIASLCRGREQFSEAVDYFKRILALRENDGETWSALGHCYLMMDNLQDAYQAYQQALYHLQSPKDPKLWYGIGILYDRYGSIEHAEEAFSAVMKMDSKFEKANEIYFRLGIIYKQQQKYDLSLQCFRYILHSPPRPLTEIDIWFQTGHVYEQQKEYELAKEAYERVLADSPEHAKVLQQLGWLFHQQNTSFSNQNTAIKYLTHSLKSDSTDAQSWYLLGRCYMAEQNYNKAYEAYQQAVYRDARNPTFWCSIGVLYYQINQYRDALDAYSRAIRLNPYISEVWYDLGTLYESCNNQIQDALDAYQRAAELDPNNPHIRQRLELLRKTNPGSGPPSTTPVPQDVHNPYQYQNSGSSNNPQYPPLSGSSPTQYPPNNTSSSGSNSNNNNRNEHTSSRMQDTHSLPPPPPPTASNSNNDHRSPLPFGSASNNNNHYHSHHSQQQQQPPREDVRIPDIGTSGNRAPLPSDRVLMNPMMESRSPIYRHSTPNSSKNMASAVRSPIPTKSSQQQFYSPRQHPNDYEEPLRRTSVLYDSEKTTNNPSPIIKREYPSNGGSALPPPLVNHTRHNSNSSSSAHLRKERNSPIESSAADTLMSMSQKGFYGKPNPTPKRMLEMADEEEPEQEEETKRPRLDQQKDGGIPVSS